MITDDPEAWEEMKDEYYAVTNSGETNKYLRVFRSIDRLELEYLSTQIGINSLRFDYSKEIVEGLQEYGYDIKEDNYLSKLDQIERENEALIIRISQLKKRLPDENNRDNIDKVIIAYNDGKILDTNSVTVTQFLALQELFEERVKAIKEQTKSIKNGR